MFWHGRPAEAPKLLDRDEVLNSEVRRRQASACEQLSGLPEILMAHIASLTALVGDQSLSTAHIQISDYLQHTCHLKDNCAMHIHRDLPTSKRTR